MAGHLFLRACRREPVERTPIWMMRQAGRYLPQYRKVRERVSFLELCKTPDLACEVTLQPIDEFGFDAAILFADILLPLEAMGLSLEFTPAPVIADPARDRAAVEKLAVPDPEAELGYVMDAVRTIRSTLAGRVPLIGFAGAPFTMATYAVEGGGSKSYVHTKGLMFSDPETFHRLLDTIAETTAAYLAAQVRAGAEAVQLFDSWAGVLAPPDFREFALRHARAVIDRLRDDPAVGSEVPIIYFVNGCSPYLADYADSGADVLGVDFRIDIGAVRAAVGDGVALQGNLDPTALFAPPETLRRRVAAVLESHGDGPGHIFNLGHGVLPPTDPERVRVMVEAVRELSTRGA